ncbi:MAG: OB-fold domain-containing protein [Halobacteriales archaeon]|nr:OB-fold domain-containing protein [Halobacteriales archaeon]
MSDSIPIEDKRESWEGPIPLPNGVTEEFWAGTVDGEFRLQHCGDCGEAQFYPRVVCKHCGSMDLDWEPASGDGTVHSYIVNHIPGEEGFGEFAPYVVAIVELEEGPHLTAMMPVDGDDVEIGTAVEARFWQISDDTAMPVFVPA